MWLKGLLTSKDGRVALQLVLAFLKSLPRWQVSFI